MTPLRVRVPLSPLYDQASAQSPSGLREARSSPHSVRSPCGRSSGALLAPVDQWLGHLPFKQENSGRNRVGVLAGRRSSGSVSRGTRAPPVSPGPDADETSTGGLLGAVVQWHGRRVLSPETGVQLPVALLLCIKVLPHDTQRGLGAAATDRAVMQSPHPMPDSTMAVQRPVKARVAGSSPALAATGLWPRIEARGCNPRYAGENPVRPSI